MTVDELHAALQANSDPAFAAFAAKLGAPTPNRPYLGVRTPILRKIAKRIAKDLPTEQFVKLLPHRFADEYLLHALLINEIRLYRPLIAALNDFLPLVDTWGNCDALAPALFKRHPGLCLDNIPTWLDSSRTYTQRFGVVMLLKHFAKEQFATEHLDWLAHLTPCKEVDVAVAWYLAEAMASHPNEIYDALAAPRFSQTVRLTAIRKAIDSRRVPAELKSRLSALRGAIG